MCIMVLREIMLQYPRTSALLSLPTGPGGGGLGRAQSKVWASSGFAQKTFPMSHKRRHRDTCLFACIVGTAVGFRRGNLCYFSEPDSRDGNAVRGKQHRVESTWALRCNGVHHMHVVERTAAVRLRLAAR